MAFLVSQYELNLFLQVPMPLSLDLRQRIVDAYTNNEGSQRQLAQRFRVGKATVERLLKRQRQTGSLHPKPHAGGRRPLITREHKALIQGWLDNNPDLTQAQIAERFTAETGIAVVRSTVTQALKRLGITRKKDDAAASDQG